MVPLIFRVNVKSPISGPQRMGLDAIALWLRVQKLANTYFGLDLIGRNPRFYHHPCTARFE